MSSNTTKTPIIYPKRQENFKNMTLVRLKKAKMKFEVICFKNQVPTEKADIEPIVHEIIQIPIIYTSVAKAQVAKPKDLQNVFKTKNNTDIVLEILKKGEIVQTASDRKDNKWKQFHDLAQCVDNVCVHSGSKNKFGLEFILEAFLIPTIKLFVTNQNENKSMI